MSSPELPGSVGPFCSDGKKKDRTHYFTAEPQRTRSSAESSSSLICAPANLQIAYGSPTANGQQLTANATGQKPAPLPTLDYSIPKSNNLPITRLTWIFGYICRLNLKHTPLMRKALILILLGMVAVSCVSKKRLTYLQKSEETSDTTNYELQRTKYKVQPNDILNIDVRSFDQETSDLFNSSQSRVTNMNAGDLIFYLTGYTVDLNGDIEMPITGKINVAGNNTEEIKALIEAELQNYFRDDAVYVTVQLAGVRYSVIGDAARPGKYVIYQNQVNIFEALAQAGDITMVGDRREVEIVRQVGNGVEVITLDLTDSQVLSNPHFFIQPNDIINIKPLGVKSFGIGTTGFQSFASVIGVLASTATLIFTLSQLSK